MRILFYGVLDTISLAMYEDLADALSRDGDEIAFEFGDTIGKQNVAEEIAKARGYRIGMSKPDVMFISDFRVYPRDKKCLVINLGHGLASKNDYYYKTAPYDSDYFFCSSKWIAKKLNGGKTKFIATGMPKLDRVKNESDGRTVLIAPTYNDEYNCLKLIGDHLKDLTNKYRVIIKPHQYDQTDWSKYGIEVRDDYNIANLFSITDVVVSDVSSACWEFMSLNKPVVVVESEYMKKLKLERPEAHEYYFQKGATAVINSGIDLLAAVDKAFEDKFNIKRYVYSKRLLSYRGRSIKQVKRILGQLQKSKLNLH